MMDYNSLKLEIQNILNRNDNMLVDEIPNIIRKAVNRINSEANSIGFQKQLRNRLFANRPTYHKPLDWKKTISLAIIVDDKKILLLPRSYEFGITYSPRDTAATPKFYSDIGYDYFYFFPTPNINYEFILTYRALLIFDELHPLNFLTGRYEGILLYAALEEAALFLKDDERIATFRSFYDRELQNINRDKTDSTADRTSKGDTN